MQYAVGVDLGGTNLRLALVDAEGNILARVHRPAKAYLDDVEKWLGYFADAVGELTGKAPEHDPAGIGFGVPAGIDHRRGVVHQAPNFSILEGLELGRLLEGRLGRQVMVDNDANAILVGEMWKGAGRGASNLIGLTLGTGVGGAAVIDGRLWHGDSGTAGEFGHMTVEAFGRACKCGSRGCLEMYASDNAIRYAARQRIDAGDHTIIRELCEGDPGRINAKLLCDAAARGDRVAQELLDEMGTYLGIGIASLVNALDIETVIVAGGVARSWSFIEQRTFEEARARAFKLPASRLRILRAELGDDAGLLGSVYQFFNRDTP